MDNKSKIVICVVLVVAVVFVIGIISTVIHAQKNLFGSDDIMTQVFTGEHDILLREKCVEKMKSYGLDPVPESSINICMDTAKAIAYHELNK